MSVLSAATAACSRAADSWRASARGPSRCSIPTAASRAQGSFTAGRAEGIVSAFPGAGPGAEPLRSCCVPPGAVRLDLLYEKGDIVQEIFYDADGRPILADGRPWPPRPSGVPDDAEYDEAGTQWARRRPELHRFWTDAGVLTSEIEYAKGVRRAARTFDAAGRLAEACEFSPDGARHGAFVRCFPAEAESPYADPRIREERGTFDQGQAVGIWSFLDAAGVELRTVARGLPSPREVRRSLPRSRRGAGRRRKAKRRKRTAEGLVGAGPERCVRRDACARRSARRPARRCAREIAPRSSVRSRADVVALAPALAAQRGEALEQSVDAEGVVDPRRARGRRRCGVGVPRAGGRAAGGERRRGGLRGGVAPPGARAAGHPPHAGAGPAPARRRAGGAGRSRRRRRRITRRCGLAGRPAPGGAAPVRQLARAGTAAGRSHARRPRRRPRARARRGARGGRRLRHPDRTCARGRPGADWHRRERRPGCRRISPRCSPVGRSPCAGRRSPSISAAMRRDWRGRDRRRARDRRARRAGSAERGAGRLGGALLALLVGGARLGGAPRSAGRAAALRRRDEDDRHPLLARAGSAQDRRPAGAGQRRPGFEWQGVDIDALPQHLAQAAAEEYLRARSVFLWLADPEASRRSRSICGTTDPDQRRAAGAGAAAGAWAEAASSEAARRWRQRAASPLLGSRRSSSR